MARASQSLTFLTAAEVIYINHRMISRFGGRHGDNNSNMVNSGCLLWVLEAVQGSIFGVDLFPTAFQKAAAIASYIIKGHVFFDGNKRTACEACRLFLELNGFDLQIDEETITIGLGIESCNWGLSDIVGWIERKTGSGLITNSV